MYEDLHSALLRDNVLRGSPRPTPAIRNSFQNTCNFFMNVCTIMYVSEYAYYVHRPISESGHFAAPLKTHKDAICHISLMPMSIQRQLIGHYYPLYLYAMFWLSCCHGSVIHIVIFVITQISSESYFYRPSRLPRLK